jgi:DNA-binding NarL/FixJ family response regulator
VVHEQASHEVLLRPATPRAESYLLLATSRPAVVAFFRAATGSGGSPFVVDPIDVSVVALDEHVTQVTRASAAVVDVGVEPVAGLELCRELHRRRPVLPIAALFCCPNSVTPWNLRELLAEGAVGLFDLHAGPEEVVRLLESLAGGGSVLHLNLRRGQRALLRELLTGREPRNDLDLRLLQFVALGLPDRDIAGRLYLSPHTVKHHIERLRDELGLRNRTELAAWAGRAGFYSPDAERKPNLQTG